MGALKSSVETRSCPRNFQGPQPLNVLKTKKIKKIMLQQIKIITKRIIIRVIITAIILIIIKPIKTGHTQRYVRPITKRVTRVRHQFTFITHMTRLLKTTMKITLTRWTWTMDMMFFIMCLTKRI